MAALIFLLVLQGMRHLRGWQWRGQPVGPFVLRALSMAIVASLALTFALELAWAHREGHNPRAAILARLQADAQRHLVIVRYRPERIPRAEWVYNRADIDAAKIVWAREMDAAQNRRLLQYFHDRRAWLLEPERRPITLVPYPTTR